MANTDPVWLDTMMAKDTYPHPVDEVELVQTHISWVFIAGDFVYKAKKPVDFGFLDFTTLEKRQHFVNEELRLNKRLCPEIYLRAVPLVQGEGGGYSLIEGAVPENGKIVEWFLKMRRMPTDYMMSRLIQGESLGYEHLELIIDRLVPFYREAKTGGDVNQYGSLKWVQYNCEENFEQTASFVGSLLDEAQYKHIVAYNREFLSREKALFENRIAQGFIREGHGDLHSANICFDPNNKETVFIFDCIEFNERFRCGDVASDLGFLAMDLDFHGLPGMSKRFLDDFSLRSKDPGIFEVMDFYKCYRAFVRAKIACFTASDPGIQVDVRKRLQQDARDYLALSFRYAGGKMPTPTVYCFMGFSGTGKSTHASRFAETHGLPLYSSDVIRKEVIAGIPREEKRVEPFGKGIYSKEFSQKTYRALWRRAQQSVLMGRSVCLDATFLDASWRRPILEIEKDLGCKVRFINFEAPDNVLKERLLEREKRGKGVSDGRYEIYLRQKEAFSPFSEEEEKRLLRVDTSGPKEKVFQEISRVFKF